jgi:hypothetical protein
VKFDVAVIVVGLNAREFVRQCMASLKTAEWRNWTRQMIYVDNGSTDGTAQMLRESFAEVKLILNERNYGYCKAANMGAGEAEARYYCFLNDDTIVLEDAIPRLIEWMDSDTDIGIGASRLLYPDLREQFSGRSFPSAANAILGRRSVLSRLFPNSPLLKRYLKTEDLKSAQPFTVDWVSAAAMMVRKEAFEAAGGLAEDYYYWHEAVFCDRAHKRGWKVMLHPLSRIIHYEGFGSGRRPYSVRRWHIIDFHRAAFRCYCEHHGLGLFSLRRLVAATGLTFRAALLLVANRLTALRSA